MPDSLIDLAVGLGDGVPVQVRFVERSRPAQPARGAGFPNLGQVCVHSDRQILVGGVGAVSLPVLELGR